MTATVSDKQSRRSSIWLIVAGLVTVLVVAGALGYRFFLKPMQDQDLIEQTSALSTKKRNCQTEVSFWDDMYGGYVYYRSEVFFNDLERQNGICVDPHHSDDTLERMEALRDGKADIAVMTIDRFLVNSVKIEEFPAVIIAFSSMSFGSDGMVGFEEAFPTLASLDHPDLHVIVTENTPSEMFAKAFHADMNLMQPSHDWLRGEKTPEKLLKQMRGTVPTEKTAFVFYEPYLSMALALPGAKSLLTTAQLSEVVADVIVVRRAFLAEHPEVVMQFFQSYQRAQYSYHQQGNQAIVNLLIEDSRSSGGDTLTSDQAMNTVIGTKWQNLNDNYVRFGLCGGVCPAGVPTIEDTIENITRILIQTGDLEGVPYEDIGSLYYPTILTDLQKSGFHPRSSLGLIQDADVGEIQAVQMPAKLPALSEVEWEALAPVPHLRVPNIDFTSGSSELTEQGKSQVNQIVRQLNAYPEFYIAVEGGVRAGSNPESDLKLATERGKTVEEALVQRGISQNRVRSYGLPPTSSSGSAQRVSFKLGQKSF